MSEHKGALAGVRVLSFGAFVAGNTVGRFLAELGADVVKIESRERPEVLRKAMYTIGPLAVEPSGIPNTVMYAALFRGMRSLSIDLTLPEARPVFHRLVAEADLVIENFAGNTLAKWGCAYEDLIKDNPRLVMLSLSGYGRTGPRAGYLGYTSTMANYIGLSSVWHYTHGMLTDNIAAATGAVAATAAVLRARRTGEPVYLDVAQIDVMAPLLARAYAAPLNLGCEEPTEVNHVQGSWLSGVFPCLGYDAWLAVEIEDGDDWTLLCQFLERTDLEATGVEASIGNEPELRDALGKWIARHTAYTAMHVLQKVGLAAAVVQSSEDIWRDPQLHARHVPERVAQPDLGTVTYPSSVQRWSKTPGTFRIPPARLGQQTNDVLREWIDLSDVELADLAGKGLIFDAS